jgi:hypothetical protein
MYVLGSNICILVFTVTIWASEQWGSNASVAYISGGSTSFLTACMELHILPCLQENPILLYEAHSVICK